MALICLNRGPAPVIGGCVGGIRRQIEDGVNGFLEHRSRR